MTSRLFFNPAPASGMGPRYRAVFLHNGQVYFQTIEWTGLIPKTRWNPVEFEPKKLIDAVIAFGNQIFGLDDQGQVHWWVGGPNWLLVPHQAGTVLSLASDMSGKLFCVYQDANLAKVDFKDTATFLDDWQLWEVDIPGQAGDVTPPTWIYDVLPGDWLWKIAENQYYTWDDPVTTNATVTKIKDLNPNGPDTSATPHFPWNGNWDDLHPGYKLTMPPRI